MQFGLAVGVMLSLAAAVLVYRGTCATDYRFFTWRRTDGGFVERRDDLTLIMSNQCWIIGWDRELWRLDEERFAAMAARYTSDSEHVALPPRPFTAISTADAPFWARLGFGVTFETNRGELAGCISDDTRFRIQLPGWFIPLTCVSLTSLLAHAVWRERRARLRARRTRCVACGYDLRGTAHERCPECGHFVPSTSHGEPSSLSKMK